MAGKVKAVPEGAHTITAHLAVQDGASAIDFYQRAFGAQVKGVHKTPDGRIMHASLKIGDSDLMLSDEFPGSPVRAPKSLGGTSVVINLMVEDVDSLWNRAVGAGAKVAMPLANQFWGDRYGQLFDPYGHSWALLSHVEDVAPEEMERRAKTVFAEMSKKAGG